MAKTLPIDLYFIRASDLDRPVYKVPATTLFTCGEFFNDYHITIFLKPVRRPQVGCLPIIINDANLACDVYYSENLAETIVQVIETFEQVRSPVYKVAYRIILLKNGWLACYIEKRHIWDGFQSVGVITIMSPDRLAVLHFFRAQFLEKLIKRPRKPKGPTPA